MVAPDWLHTFLPCFSRPVGPCGTVCVSLPGDGRAPSFLFLLSSVSILFCNSKQKETTRTCFIDIGPLSRPCHITMGTHNRQVKSLETGMSLFLCVSLFFFLFVLIALSLFFFDSPPSPPSPPSLTLRPVLYSLGLQQHFDPYHTHWDCNNTSHSFPFSHSHTPTLFSLSSKTHSRNLHTPPTCNDGQAV